MFDFLRKLLAKVRAKMHGDIYAKIELAEQRIIYSVVTRVQAQELLLKKAIEMNGALSKNTHGPLNATHDLTVNLNAEIPKMLTALEGQFAELKQWHQTAFYNQIALANMATGPFTLMTPWSSERKRLHLERLASGQLCFMQTTPETLHDSPVFLVTMPKSGTWLTKAIMAKLGFQDICVTTLGESIEDNRNPDTVPKVKLYPNHNQKMPYALQVELTLPGQFLSGHLDSAEPALWSLFDKNVLLTVRDLRTSLISWMRFLSYVESGINNKKIPVQDFFSSEDLCKFIERPESAAIAKSALVAIQIKNSMNAELVRFEELTAMNREGMAPSAQAIVSATGCSLDEVLRTIEECQGVTTRTYTGQLSNLKGLWNEEVEILFAKRGWDVINEKLGYPRKYSPELYD